MREQCGPKLLHHCIVYAALATFEQGQHWLTDSSLAGQIGLRESLLFACSAYQLGHPAESAIARAIAALPGRLTAQPTQCGTRCHRWPRAPLAQSVKETAIDLLRACLRLILSQVCKMRESGVT